MDDFGRGLQRLGFVVLVGHRRLLIGFKTPVPPIAAACQARGLVQGDALPVLGGPIWLPSVDWRRRGT